MMEDFTSQDSPRVRKRDEKHMSKLNQKDMNAW
jgi:hypothetical protein